MESFSKTETELALKFAEAMSSQPSPLKSPLANDKGFEPAENGTATEKAPSPAP